MEHPGMLQVDLVCFHELCVWLFLISVFKFVSVISDLGAVGYVAHMVLPLWMCPGGR